MEVEVTIIQKRRYNFLVEVDEKDMNFLEHAQDKAYEIYEDADNNGTLEEYFSDSDIEFEV